MVVEGILTPEQIEKYKNGDKAESLENIGMVGAVSERKAPTPGSLESILSEGVEPEEEERE